MNLKIIDAPGTNSFEDAKKTLFSYFSMDELIVNTFRLKYFLSDHECDLTAMINSRGKTPLHLACECDSMETVNLLLKYVSDR